MKECEGHYSIDVEDNHTKSCHPQQRLAWNKQVSTIVILASCKCHLVCVARLTILSDRLKDSLKYVIVDNDMQQTETVEVTVSYQREE